MCTCVRERVCSRVGMCDVAMEKICRTTGIYLILFHPIFGTPSLTLIHCLSFSHFPSLFQTLPYLTLVIPTYLPKCLYMQGLAPSELLLNAFKLQSNTQKKEVNSANPLHIIKSRLIGIIHELLTLTLDNAIHF